MQGLWKGRRIVTDQEINIAIAEACGYYYGRTVDDPLFGCWRTPSGKQTSTGCVPDYCHDLNAMHAVEAGMVGHQMIRYQAELSSLGTKNPHVSCWDIIHADSRQRAEAFLRTIGKWRD